MKSVAKFAVLLLLVVATVVPAGAAAVGTPTGDAPLETVSTPTNNSTTTAPTNNSTATSSTDSAAPPTLAEQARVTPVKFDESFLGVHVREPGQVFETTGPFVVFTVSEQLEAVRVNQQKATARVLEGGHAVKVSYADDAAPLGNQSLYTLQLFFADGSSRSVKLYASKTGVSVAAADLQKYREVLEELKEFAKAHGYGTSPEELENYLKFINDRADLVEGFLMEKAKQLLGLAIAAGKNWLFWMFFLGGLALAAQWLKKRWGDMLESLQNDTGRADRKRRELELAYAEQKQTADEESLEDVDAVGSNAVYWEEAFGARSPAQLANLATRGAHYRDRDGDLEQEHAGVDDLDVENLQESWLEPVLRGNRIPTAKQALGEIKATCEHLETQYNLGHLYRDTRDECEAMIRELERREQMSGDASRGD